MVSLISGYMRCMPYKAVDRMIDLLGMLHGMRLLVIEVREGALQVGIRR